MRTRGGHDYIFDPSASELETCRSLYSDLTTAIAKRPTITLTANRIAPQSASTDLDSDWGDERPQEPSNRGRIQ